MNNEMNIGTRIAELREKNKISRNQLAGYMPVSAQAVGKWERGESLPDIIMLKKLADIFGVPMEAFFSDSAENCSAVSKQLHETEEKSLGKAVKDSWNMSMSSWKDADFSGLKNIAEKFNCSNIQNCNFSDAVLSGIMFKSNSIQKNKFVNADLSNSNFKSCRIQRSNFEDSRFCDSIFSNCSIGGCDFGKTNFLGTTFKYCTLSKNTMSAARFEGTVFSFCSFSNMNIDNDFTDCSFSGCGFTNMTFSDTVFRNCFFKNDRIRKSTFINCKADSISYSFLKLCKGDISGITVIE